MIQNMNPIEHARMVILKGIDQGYASDADFERVLQLTPKTVNNWRRKKSTSFLKFLPEIQSLLKVSYGDLFGYEEVVQLTEEEQALIKAYRTSSVLSQNKRKKLYESLLIFIEEVVGKSV